MKKLYFVYIVVFLSTFPLFASQLFNSNSKQATQSCEMSNSKNFGGLFITTSHLPIVFHSIALDRLVNNMKTMYPNFYTQKEWDLFRYNMTKGLFTSKKELDKVRSFLLESKKGYRFIRFTKVIMYMDYRTQSKKIMNLAQENSYYHSSTSTWKFVKGKFQNVLTIYFNTFYFGNNLKELLFL